MVDLQLRRGQWRSINIRRWWRHGVGQKIVTKLSTQKLQGDTRTGKVTGKGGSARQVIAKPALTLGILVFLLGF